MINSLIKKTGKWFLCLWGVYDISKFIFAFDVVRGKYTYQTNVFGRVWKEYLSHNSYQEELALLTKDLDDQSKELAYLLVDRFQNILSLHPALISSALFTKDEIDQQRSIKSNLKKVLAKYGFSEKFISVGPLCNDSGLIYLPDTIIDSLKGTIFIDGGAYVGQASIPFLKYTPEKIYCFEPVTSNHQILLRHIQKNKAQDKIIPVQKALGKDVGRGTITVQGNSSSLANVSLGDGNAETIAIDTIDNFVEENNLNSVGLIKLDVEGFETNVIMGSLNTIEKFKPVLLISVYHCPNDFFKIKPLLQEKFKGYTFLIRKTNPFWFTYDTLLIGFCC